MLTLAVRRIEIEVQSKPYSNRKVKKKVGGGAYRREEAADKTAVN